MASSSSSSSSSSNNHDGNAHGIPVSIQGFEGFAVHPLDTCPHVELVETIPQEFELGHPCGVILYFSFFFLKFKRIILNCFYYY